MKQSVMLGLRDTLQKNFDNMINDMLSKFKNKQHFFSGHRKTYTALGDFADDPTKRSHVHVSSTVDEQLQWIKGHVQDYFRNVLSIEKTNASGIEAELIVKGESWGMYTSLELLRLKSIVDSKFREVLKEIPVRPETSIWTKTKDENYAGREVYEDKLVEAFASTTLKESYILTDPHPDMKRAPQVGEKTTKVNVGSYTSQNFSGEITLRERAEYMVKLNDVYTGIIEALEKANDTEAKTSDLGEKFLDYMFAK